MGGPRGFPSLGFLLWKMGRTTVATRIHGTLVEPPGDGGWEPGAWAANLDPSKACTNWYQAGGVGSPSTVAFSLPRTHAFIFLNRRNASRDQGYARGLWHGALERKDTVYITRMRAPDPGHLTTQVLTNQ